MHTHLIVVATLLVSTLSGCPDDPGADNLASDAGTTDTGALECDECGLLSDDACERAAWCVLTDDGLTVQCSWRETDLQETDCVRCTTLPTQTCEDHPWCVVVESEHWDPDAGFYHADQCQWR